MSVFVCVCVFFVVVGYLEAATSGLSTEKVVHVIFQDKIQDKNQDNSEKQPMTC